ncbi:MAG TPA: iron donor protein CyaY [Polyangiaceae bacterium]|jgi:CyaY protein|nr:iron donor protein CyaY [Polyangiaceae bacterium]
MTELSESEFEKAADQELAKLLGALDASSLDLEVELSMGVLTIELSDKSKYVINSHRAAKQIWLAAERSAWHFDLDPGASRWVAQKNGDELWSTVEGVLSKKLGAPVSLRPG